MKALKLLGIGSIKDQELHKNLLIALESIEYSFNLKLVSNVNEIVNHGVRSTPALILDNQILIQGKSCNHIELIEILRKVSVKTKA